MKNTLVIQYGIVLIIGIAFAAISYRLNQKAFINNLALFETIVGVRADKVKFSARCTEQIQKQLDAARAAGANQALIDTFDFLLKTPALFLKRVQDIIYLNAVSNDRTRITLTHVTATLSCGTLKPAPIKFEFDRDKDFLLCTDIAGLDSLFTDVSRAFNFSNDTVKK